MEQLIAHLFGDYILQSDWMAQNKTKRWLPAAIHAFIYSLCFVPLICFHGRDFNHGYSCWLARYVVWAKNFMAPKGSVPNRWDGQEQQSYPRRNWDWQNCKDTGGYAPNTPAFMWIWLSIAADNAIHLAINYAALRWL